MNPLATPEVSPDGDRAATPVNKRMPFVAQTNGTLITPCECRLALRCSQATNWPVLIGLQNPQAEPEVSPQGDGRAGDYDRGVGAYQRIFEKDTEHSMVAPPFTNAIVWPA